MGQVKEVPMPENKRNEIFLHRKQEMWAQSEYTKARRRLWDLLTTPRLEEQGIVGGIRMVDRPAPSTKNLTGKQTTHKGEDQADTIVIGDN